MAILSSPIATIQSIPTVTRYWTVSTIAASCLYAWLEWKGYGSEAAPYLTLVPGSALFAPWTLVISGLVETTILELIFTVIFVPASLRYLERIWGGVELLKFIVVCIGLSNVIAFGFNWLEFMVLGQPELFLYGMRYHGQMALQIGVLVAFTQLIPEHQIQIGIITTRIKTLPMAYLTLSTVLCFIGLQCPWIIIQFGWFVSWVYLRFYKKNTDTLGAIVTYGDRSETFSLISWFPPLLHKPLTLLGNTVFALATKLRLLPNSASHDVEIGTYGQLPGTARAEAERRRALALKALDQRLANSSSPGAGGSSSNPPRSTGSVPAPTSNKLENGAVNPEKGEAQV